LIGTFSENLSYFRIFCSLGGTTASIILSTSSRLIKGALLVSPCLISKYRSITLSIFADRAMPIPNNDTFSVVENVKSSTYPSLSFTYQGTCDFTLASFSGLKRLSCRIASNLLIRISPLKLPARGTRKPPGGKHEIMILGAGSGSPQTGSSKFDYHHRNRFTSFYKFNRVGAEISCKTSW
jgi:hypothetical protein